MATPITAKTFKMIVADALDGVFREVYGEKSFENEYMVEVNFDGQDELGQEQVGRLTTKNG